MARSSGLCIFIIVQILLTLISAKREVKQILFEDVLGSDYGMQGENKRLTLTLDDDQLKTAVLAKKESLFNGDVQVEKCEKGSCNTEKIDEKMKNEMKECTYEGKLADDPNSRVAITKCGKSLNLGLISEKANLSSSTFRQEDGNILKNEAQFVAEPPIKKKDSVQTLTENTFEDLKKGTIFIGKQKEVYIYKEDKDGAGKDYANKEGVCCFLKKRSCVALKSGRLKCKALSSRRICGTKCYEIKSKVFENSRQNLKNLKKVFKQRLRESVKSKKKPAKGKKPKKAPEKLSKKETFEKNLHSKERSTETPEGPAEEQSTDFPAKAVTETAANKTFDEQTFTRHPGDQEETPEESDEEHDEVKDNPKHQSFELTQHGFDADKGEESEEDYDEYDSLFKSEEDEDEEYEEDTDYGDSEKSKRVKELMLGELNSLYTSTENYKMRGAPDPEDGGQMFKSKITHIVCIGGCVPKSNNPTKHIYEQRTIEVGIFTDKYLYNNMKEQVGGTEKDVENRMLRMIHSLMVLTETLMKDESISRDGGFNLAINGISLWKDDDANPFAAKIHQGRTTSEMLKIFSEFSKKNNEPYDGYQKSYDIMILLTGAHAQLGLSRGSDSGLAYVNQVCKVEPNLVLTVNLRDGMHLDNAGVLLAHEMGHLLGSYHDGGEDEHGNYLNCDNWKFIMAAVHSGRSNKIWSTCSRQQIDEKYTEREEKEPEKGNCFFT